jgi:hypothetical protein
VTRDLEALKARVDVRTLARDLRVKVLPNGREAHCFNANAHSHEDRNPSLSLDRERFTCHAAGCGVKGDAIELVKLVHGVSFKEALDWLAGYVGEPGTRPRTAWTPHKGGTRAGAGEEPKPMVPVRLAIMAELWNLVRDLELTQGARDWLASRGVRPEVAHDLGCRDWSPAMKPIAAMLKAHSPEDKRAAGFYNDQAELWFPFAALVQGNERFGGLCVPQWLPEYPHPIAWRWRLYQPTDRFKTVAQPGLEVLPLGLGVSNPTYLLPATSYNVVFVVEGEPDWLSVYDVAEHYAGALGICSIARGWRDAWTQYLDQASRVVVMVHQGEPKRDGTRPGEVFASAVALAMVRRYGREEATRRFMRQLLDEGQDANDLHRAGQLRPLVEALAKGD